MPKNKLNQGSKQYMTYTLKIIKHWWRKVNMIQEMGVELILLKWPYYLQQSTNLMQFLSKYQGYFSENWNKLF